MADFPDPTLDDKQTPREAITVSAPALDRNEDHEKSAEQLAVEQQWRDVEALGLDKQHPLSINRDSDLVTDDPYSS